MSGIGRSARRAGIAVPVLLLACAGNVAAQDDDELAHRFRPYIKTTLDDGRDEAIHPANWQWIIARADLYRGDTLLASANTLANDHTALADQKFDGDLTVNGAGQKDPQLVLRLVSTDARGGEPWADVIGNGHGIYAHVEHLDDVLVNIEYTIVWPHNAATGSNHDGDLTTLVVLYDRRADRLSRVTFSMHGCFLEAYDLMKPRAIRYEVLTGKDEALRDSLIEAARIEIDDRNGATDNTGCAPSASEGHVFLAADPDSHLYEHPVVFVENGAHELWPNPSGFLSAAPGHRGDGVSFLPACVQVLGTMASPREPHQPFVHYNGKFGTDPQAIALHSTWFWGPQILVRANRLTDLYPYKTIGNLQWPPPAWSGPPAQVFVTARGATAPAFFDGARERPIRGLPLAYSMTPAGSTLSLTAGAYGDPVVLKKPMLLVRTPQ